jgi:hypothetical protein
MSPATPFGEVHLLLVDGNNLLHRTAGGPGIVTARLLLGRLRAVMPASMKAIVVLDGPPDPGAPMREAAGSSLEIRHAGRHSADDIIVGLVADQSYQDRARTVVVSDDRALRDRVAHLGGLARRLQWLDGSAALAPRGPRSAPGESVAGPRPPRPARPSPGHDPHRSSSGAAAGPEPGPEGGPGEADEHRWEPGRGATRKRGNAHRGRPEHRP